MRGKLEKLTIEAYDNSKYEGDSKEEYVVMYNPTSFNRKVEVEYNDAQGPGTTASPMVFNKIKPQQYTVELFIDGTGTSGSETDGEKPVKKDVAKEIDKFLKVCGEFKGDLHRPFYLKLFWAKLVLKAVLVSADITYTLFKPDGTPLRAKISAVFKGSIDNDLRAAEEAANSPDLTHVRIVKEGDTLPLMTHQMYGNASLYLEVARVNELNNFRDLKAGEKIFFPPVISNG